MAKDGTMRGGARVGSGRKSKALTEKIGSGLAASVIDLPEPEEISGEDVPPVKEFLKAAQKSGIDLCAEDVFKSTFLWLKERGCDRLVNTQLIEQYAMSVSRWVQCETCISEYGFLAKHPTTGAAITPSKSSYPRFRADSRCSIRSSWGLAPPYSTEQFSFTI